MSNPFRIKATVVAMLASLSGGCGSSDSSVDAVAEAAPTETPSPTIVDTRPNAATNYTSIHERMGQGFFDPMVNFDPEYGPTASETAFLISQQELVRDIIAASKIERCDFRTNFNDGMHVLIPQMSWMRHCCMLLRDDAYRFIQEPSGQSGAAERMAAIVRIGKQAGAEPVVVSKLIGIVCVGLSTNLVANHRDRLTDPRARETIRKELETVIGSDLFDVRAALNQELITARTTLNNGKTLDIGGEKFQFSQQERAPIIAELERAYSEMIKACDAPDAEYQFQSIADSMSNLKARMFVAAYDVFIRHVNKSKGEINAALAALKK